MNARLEPAPPEGRIVVEKRGAVQLIGIDRVPKRNGFSERMVQDLRDLPGRYAAPHGGLFLALCDGQPVATAAWTRYTSTLAEMKRVYVQPDHRGKGIAQALSQRIIGETRQRGFAQVGISTWRSASACWALACFRGRKLMEANSSRSHQLVNSSELAGIFVGRVDECVSQGRSAFSIKQ